MWFAAGLAIGIAGTTFLLVPTRASDPVAQPRTTVIDTAQVPQTNLIERAFLDGIPDIQDPIIVLVGMENTVWRLLLEDGTATSQLIKLPDGSVRASFDECGESVFVVSYAAATDSSILWLASSISAEPIALDVVDARWSETECGTLVWTSRTSSGLIVNRAELRTGLPPRIVALADLDAELQIVSFSDSGVFMQGLVEGTWVFQAIGPEEGSIRTLGSYRYLGEDERGRTALSNPVDASIPAAESPDYWLADPISGKIETLVLPVMIEIGSEIRSIGWSQDGRRSVIVTSNPLTGEQRAIIGSTDGGESLVSVPGEVIDFDWNADGSRLYLLHPGAISIVRIAEATYDSIPLGVPANQITVP